MRLAFGIHVVLFISLIVFLCSLSKFFLSHKIHWKFFQSKQRHFHHLQFTLDKKNVSYHLQSNTSILRQQILGTNSRFQSLFHRFEYVNPSKLICQQVSHPEKSLIIIVLSRALNLDYRQAIRATWGRNYRYSKTNITVQTVFFVGIDDSLESAIQIEQNLFNDVVRINVPEHMSMMAYKELAALFWLRLYCPLVGFLFRIDDDMLLNTHLLLDYLTYESDFNKNEGIYGWFRQNVPVYRIGRWPVTKEEYSSNVYAAYTFTNGYLFSNKSCHQLIQTANQPNHYVIRISDAYITGILRESARISHYSYSNLEYVSTYFTTMPCLHLFQNKPRLLVCTSKLHSGKRQHPIEYYEIWNVLLSKMK